MCLSGFVPSIENAFGMACTSLPYNSIKGNRVLVFLLMNASLVKHSVKMHRCFSCMHASCTPDSCLSPTVVRYMLVTQYVLSFSSVVEHWLHKPGVLGSIPSDCWLFTFLRFSPIIKIIWHGFSLLMVEIFWLTRNRVLTAHIQLKCHQKFSILSWQQGILFVLIERTP